MILAAPEMLWLLVLLVLPLCGFFWWAWRKRQQLITQFISARLLSHLKVGVSATRQKARMALIVAAVVFLVLALARPQWGYTQEEAHQRGLDIIFAIDTSKSMLAEDVAPNRLERAKLAALDLAHKARTDRLGLVAFAGSAFLQCPLTLDDAAFSQSVSELDTRTVSQGGTAIAEAIEEALRAFKKQGDSHRVLVLFTDGEENDGEAVPAAQKAAEEGVHIFTIGIGSAEGEVLRIRDERGRVDFIRDEEGKPVKSKLNEDLLQQVARSTPKGFYLHLQGTKTMDTLYDLGIAPLPKSDNATRLFQRYRERFYWPLAVAMVLLVVETFMPDRKGRGAKTPASEPAATLAGTAVLLLLLALPATARADDAGKALREYQSGKYQDALKDYDHLLETSKDDPRLRFNAGTAAYQGSNPDEAIKQFQAALKSQDLILQQKAYYNLANSLYRKGESDPDAAKKQESWENALKQYTNALTLNRNDQDARYNIDFVNRQIEELKKQQQQSDKNNQQKQDQKQDQKDQNQSNSSQQQQQQNQQKNQSKQDQNSRAQNQPKPQPQPDQQKQDSAQNQAGKPNPDKSNGQNQSSTAQQEKSKEEQEREAAMMAAGEMTPSQAEQLLDAEKGEEMVWKPAFGNQPHKDRPVKDW